MKRLITLSLLLVALTIHFQIAQAKGDEFGDVVKAIERFYNVKHKGIPFLARAGIKTARRGSADRRRAKTATCGSGEHEGRLLRRSGF